MSASLAKWRRPFGNFVLGTVVVGVIAGIGYFIFQKSRVTNDSAEMEADHAHEPDHVDGTMPARVSREARQNLGLNTKAVAPEDYFRRIELPGLVVDRPGVSDRGVAAPIAGVVSKIHAFPGSMVAPHAPLCTLRLVSDTIHTAQLELFKATKEIEIARQQRQRLEGLAASGGVAGVRMIELENEIQRMEVAAHGYRQSLTARGLSTEQITAAAQGDFVTEITVRAPGEPLPLPNANPDETNNSNSIPSFFFEIQTLNVALGQQVEAGAILSVLADHRSLLIEGRGFRKDLPQLQQAADLRLPVEVVFDSNDHVAWPENQQLFQIEHIANVVDPTSRTFAFYLPLANQWRSIGTETNRLIWRFRPGDRVRIFLAVEPLPNVFVLPTAAVVREGGEAYVFRQNGDLFDRISVHVVHEDSQSVIIANDGKLRKNAFIVQNVASSLNRILKAQMASGTQTNLHVHADGTVHEAH
ncbi:MAG: hypothetical protein JNL67_02800 [Planctomycetaceae bacterium]|nr:hypothetical protein [Planctomycetaceae bacterium]